MDFDKKKDCRDGSPFEEVYCEFLEQSGNLSILLHIDGHGAGSSGQSRHAHNFTRNGNEESCAAGDHDLANSDQEVLWPADEIRVIG